MMRRVLGRMLQPVLGDLQLWVIVVGAVALATWAFFAHPEWWP